MVRVGGIGRTVVAAATVVALGSGVTGCGVEVALLGGEPPKRPDKCGLIAPETAQRILGDRFEGVTEEPSGECDFALTDGSLDASVDTGATPEDIREQELYYKGAEQVAGLGDRALYDPEHGSFQSLLVESGSTLVEVRLLAQQPSGDVRALLIAMAKGLLDAR